MQQRTQFKGRNSIVHKHMMMMAINSAALSCNLALGFKWRE